MIKVEPAIESGEIVRFRMARTIFGRPAYYTAAYWVDGLLIDTGCAHTSRQLTSALKTMPTDQVVNTHSHEDHIGANASMQQNYQSAIFAHPDALPILANPRLQPLQPYRRIFWGWPKPSRGQAINDWIETENHRFQVIHTPGHSPDHICLFEPDQGWLFSGDAYIGGKDRALREGYDIHGIIASLKTLAQLPVKTVFSGSGSVRHDGRRHLQDKVEYLEDLGEQILALRNQGLSARRIRRKLFGREIPIAYITLGHFSGIRLVRSYLAGFPPIEPTAEPKQPTTEPSPTTQDDSDQPATDNSSDIPEPGEEIEDESQIDG